MMWMSRYLWIYCTLLELLDCFIRVYRLHSVLARGYWQDSYVRAVNLLNTTVVLCIANCYNNRQCGEKWRYLKIVSLNFHCKNNNFELVQLQFIWFMCSNKFKFFAFVHALRVVPANREATGTFCSGPHFIGNHKGPTTCGAINLFTHAYMQ